MTEIIEGTQEAQDIRLKAVVTATDQGIFEAVISTEAMDRENDRVSAAGMVKALSKWPRMIPLTWEHGEEPKDIIGVIDPTTAEAVNGEVKASGKIDLESRLGGDAWRAFKAKSIAFSFHFMYVPGQGAVKNAQGGMDIMEFDVFEITSTRMPMNNGTRVISAKSAEALADHLDDFVAALAEVSAGLKALTDRFDEQQKAAEVEVELTRTAHAVDELKQRSDQTILALATDGASLRKSTPATPEPPPEPPNEAALKRQSREVMLALLTGGTE